MQHRNKQEVHTFLFPLKFIIELDNYCSIYVTIRTTILMNLGRTDLTIDLIRFPANKAGSHYKNPNATYMCMLLVNIKSKLSVLFSCFLNIHFLRLHKIKVRRAVPCRDMAPLKYFVFFKDFICMLQLHNLSSLRWHSFV